MSTDPGRREHRPQLGRPGAAARPAGQARRGQVDRARDVPGDRVDRLDLAPVAGRRSGRRAVRRRGQRGRRRRRRAPAVARAHHDVARPRRRARRPARPAGPAASRPANPPSSTRTSRGRPSAASTTAGPPPGRPRRRRPPPGARPGPRPARSAACSAAGSGSGCRPPAPGGPQSSASRSTKTAPGMCPARYVVPAGAAQARCEPPAGTSITVGGSALREPSGQCVGRDQCGATWRRWARVVGHAAE